MNDRGQAGFTLVEALVAFAILATMLVAGLQLGSTSLRAIDAAGATQGAVLVAQSRMDRIVALQALPVERRGTIEGSPYAWELQVLPQDPAWSRQAQARQLVHVRLHVLWRGPRGPARIHLDRLVPVAEPVRP